MYFPIYSLEDPLIQAVLLGDWSIDFKKIAIKDNFDPMTPCQHE